MLQPLIGEITVLLGGKAPEAIVKKNPRREGDHCAIAHPNK